PPHSRKHDVRYVAVVRDGILVWAGLVRVGRDPGPPVVHLVHPARVDPLQRMPVKQVDVVTREIIYVYILSPSLHSL
ncbi:MAG: hypothetical protein MI749_10055, partial [Desulfovibrionales bacterium]|nr:hypothetical protein [Desulfovibrionales bacterium]